MARQKQIRELREAERAAQKARDEAEEARAITRRVRRRTARAVVAMAAAEARRTGASVPDLLRARLGAGDADAILADAGVTAPPEVPRGPAQARSSPWAGSPDHDERVVQALVHGASDGELARIRAEVAAEYAGKSLERQARQQSTVMWRTGRGELVMDGAPAVIGASYAGGVPAQRSQIRTDVPELGSEET
jgi:hypothetical protein